MEDEVDWDDWLDFSELQPFSDYNATEEADEMAGFEELIGEETTAPKVEEIHPAGPVVKELEGEEDSGNNINLDLENILVNNTYIDSHLQRCDEAMKIAESLHLFISAHNINHTYLVTRGSFISFTSVTDLEECLTLGFGKEEVLAQLEIYKSRVQDLEELVKKYKL